MHLLPQVLPDQAQDPASDPWAIADRDPLALHLPSSHTYPKEAVYVMEKNWMPFVYKVGLMGGVGVMVRKGTVDASYLGS